MPPVTVFVGGLPEDCRESDVEDFFAKSKYGQVESIRLRRGFGFVDFNDRRDADDCMADLDGERLMGSRIRLDIANSQRGGGGGGGRGGRDGGRGRDDRGRDSGGRGGGGGRGGRPHRTDHVIEIENLSSSVSWMDLKDLFRKVGEVTYTDANQRSGRNRGEVCFSSRSEMFAAKKQFDGEDINGRRIKIIIPGGGRDSRSGSRSRSRSGSRTPPRSARKRSRSTRSRSDSRSKSKKNRSNSRSRSPAARSPPRKDDRSMSRSRSPAKKDDRNGKGSPSRSRDRRSRSRSPGYRARR